MRWLPLLLIVLLVALPVAVACTDDDDDDDDETGVTDDDDDDNDDDNDDNDDDGDDDDDDNDDDDDDDSPAPPSFAAGLILPPDSLECTPQNTGVPQLNCNHHASSIAELPDGSLAVVWYHGVAEKSPDSRIVWSQLAPGESEWSWPKVLYDDPDRSDGNATIWVGENDELFVAIATIFGEEWNQAKLRLISSTDDGATWSDPVFLRQQQCWNIRHRPLRLPGNEWLLPLYQECLGYPVFIRSTDNFTTWTPEAHFELDYFMQHLGQIQPALTLPASGRVVALTRDGMPTHRVKRMISDDGGRTWTPSRSVKLPNAGTGIDQVLLDSGHTVAIFNNDPHTRFPISAALSYDDGRTYVAIRHLNDECEDDDCAYSYPSVLQDRNGDIWVTYSVNRQTIGWVRFNEAWLAEGIEEPNLGW